MGHYRFYPDESYFYSHRVSFVFVQKKRGDLLSLMDVFYRGYNTASYLERFFILFRQAAWMGISDTHFGADI